MTDERDLVARLMAFSRYRSGTCGYCDHIGFGEGDLALIEEAANVIDRVSRRQATRPQEEVIRRARELAALADAATPGPWVPVPLGSGGCAIRMNHSPVQTWYGVECVRRDADAALIAAAPEMAELLNQLADALDAEK